GVVACQSGNGPVTVVDVRIGQPTGPNAALYLTASAEGQDRLLGAETDVAREVELHESTTNDDGTVSMRPVDDVEIPTESSLVFEPGGFHLMLFDVERLEVGDVVEVILMWETSGEMAVEAQVVDPGDTVGHGG
ncbi:MAG TPA: copper chaperone PCu(A)C, partial [Acidimicrobiia bacterium]|nr:copper chaperone PCu(A)C [Acidimicrobiia bacterium]